ncbi:MAG: serine hydrolase [Acidobacteria bacterium]|nr:serine hydrolase [Acidobacteriota bacterium]
MSSILAHLQNEIERGTFPSAQFVIAEGGHIVAEQALGNAVLEPKKIAATEHTIYDLASLTKPLLTTLLVLRFAERGQLDLHAPASAYLVELSHSEKADLTVLQLLTHTSRLPAWRPLYLEVFRRADVVAAIAHAPRDPVNDTKLAPVALYSDLNFILLGFILERLSGARLDQLAQQEVITPLALQRTRFNPPVEWQSEMAATERGQRHERHTVTAMKFVCPLRPATQPSAPQPLRRKAIIWGEVHDGNAYFMDGVAGHAGLFSTAREVFILASQFLKGSQLLKEESLHWFTRNFTAGQREARSVGWLLAATEDCSAGSALPPEAFGHNGFTGTSVWVDAAAQRVLVLLTNRVHPQVRDLGIKQARQQFHALAVGELHRRSKAL